MRGFILFLWISLLVFLIVRGAEIDEKTSLCEHCNTYSIQECLEEDSMMYNFTVACQRADQSMCLIAFADNGENVTTDFMCFTRKTFEQKKSLDDIDQRGPKMMLDTATEVEIPVTTENNFKTTSEPKAEDNEKMKENKESADSDKGETAQEHAASNDQAATEKIDFDELPQGDQPMPEMKTLEENLIMDTGKNMESKEKFNSNQTQAENMEGTREDEPKMNTVESLGTLTQSKCFQCTNADDSDCVEKPSKEVLCKPAEGKMVGCFTLFKDKKFVRGCLEDLDELQRSHCLNGDKTCSICYGNTCNDEPWPQCYVCHSTHQDAICASQAPQTALRHLARVCPNYDDACQVEVTENGATVRSCVAQPVAQSTSSRMVCNTTLCNGGIFPKERLRCHQCRDTPICDLEQPANLSLPCPVFKKEESCFFYANGKGTMQRGCSSSIGDFQQCLMYDEKRCRTCSTSDGCNSLPLLSEPKFSCIQCDTRFESGNSSMGCAWAQSVYSSAPCRKKVFYYSEESCQMINQPDIELFVRGCSHDIGVCESSYASCSQCEYNACNVEGFMWQHCLQCNSERNKKCGSAKGIVSEKCNSKDQTYETRGCYTSFNSETNTTTRGCIVDLSTEERKYCNMNEKLCVFCHEHGCNSQSASSAGKKLTMENGFRIFLLLLIYGCL